MSDAETDVGVEVGSVVSVGGPEAAELTRRALSAWFRAGESVRPEGEGVITVDGKTYVVLYLLGPDGKGQIRLGVYRVRPSDGVLRRMKRPPWWLAMLPPQ